MKDGSLQDGDAKEWWAMSSVSNRSGIGITRQDRRKLQRMITSFERENNPELVEAIEVIIGDSKDVYRGVMEYLNDFDTQNGVRENADELTEAVVNFLLQTRKDADAITEEVLSNE